MQEEKQSPQTDSNTELQVSQIIGRLEEAVKRPSVVKPPPVQSDVPPEREPSPDPPPHSNSHYIMSQLQELMSFADEDGETMSLPELCEVSRLSVACHAVSALSSVMDRAHLAALNAKINVDTTFWTLDLFRCNPVGMNVCYHDEQYEGAVRVVRALLISRIPEYADRGYVALASSQPIIYTSVASPAGLVHHICRQLGLPLSCISVVTSGNRQSGSQKMDVAALEQMIQADLAAGDKIPLIVLSDAGSSMGGYVESVAEVRDVCKKHDVWLHVRGHALAALALIEPSPGDPVPMEKIGDSMTIPLGIWLGVPGVPTVTIYDFEKLSPPNKSIMDPGKKLLPLPLWATLQSLDRDEIRQRLRDNFDRCYQLWQLLSNYASIRLLSQPPGGEGPATTNVDDLMSKTVDPGMLLEAAPCTVVFQFIPENVESRVPPYYNKLNSWLVQMVMRECGPLVSVTLCEIESGDVVIRYCPFEPPYFASTLPDFKIFLTTLQQQIEILAATAKQRGTFQRLVEQSAVLKAVEVDGWAGLGGVRYVPQSFTGDLTEHARRTLDTLNLNLVERLQSTDAAFSLGEGPDGMACVRFGMVTHDTDVSELLGLVEAAGLEEEHSGQVLDSMAQVVKKGIEAATQELQRESEEALWQEGLLRQVPVVGTFLRWWAPSDRPPPGVRGRTLDLTAGIVATTENIYRYHMQTPPSEPLERLSVSGHSRSSSSSVSSSAQPQPPAQAS